MNVEQSEHTVLVVHASARGSTAEIAEFLAHRMRENGLHVRVAAAAEDIDPAGFEAVVLGSAVRDGAFLPEFTAYVDRHCLALRLRPAWLFSVGMGPALHGPLGSLVKHLTPPELRKVRKQVCPLGFRQFAGVFPRPDERRIRIIMWLLGCRTGDQRDWSAITAWADTLTTWIDSKLPPTRFPALREPAAAPDSGH